MQEAKRQRGLTESEGRNYTQIIEDMKYARGALTEMPLRAKQDNMSADSRWLIDRRNWEIAHWGEEEDIRWWTKQVQYSRRRDKRREMTEFVRKDMNLLDKWCGIRRMKKLSKRRRIHLRI